LDESCNSKPKSRKFELDEPLNRGPVHLEISGFRF